MSCIPSLVSGLGIVLINKEFWQLTTVKSDPNEAHSSCLKYHVAVSTRLTDITMFLSIQQFPTLTSSVPTASTPQHEGI